MATANQQSPFLSVSLTFLHFRDNRRIHESRHMYDSLEIVRLKTIISSLLYTVSDTHNIRSPLNLLIRWLKHKLEVTKCSLLSFRHHLLTHIVRLSVENNASYRDRLRQQQLALYLMVQTICKRASGSLNPTTFRGRRRLLSFRAPVFTSITAANENLHLNESIYCTMTLACPSLCPSICMVVFCFIWWRIYNPLSGSISSILSAFPSVCICVSAIFFYFVCLRMYFNFCMNASLFCVCLFVLYANCFSQWGQGSRGLRAKHIGSLN